MMKVKLRRKTTYINLNHICPLKSHDGDKQLKWLFSAKVFVNFWLILTLVIFELYTLRYYSFFAA